MGTLHPLHGGLVRCLKPYTSLGREPSCGVVVPRDDRRVSRLHAVLLWRGGRWWVRDLGSRRGTFVDGRRIPGDQGVTVQEGARLGLGAPEGHFVLGSVRGPRPFVRHRLSGHEEEESDLGAISLPGGVLVNDLERGWLWVPEGQEPLPWEPALPDWTLHDPDGERSEPAETDDGLRTLVEADLYFEVQSAAVAPRVRLVWPDLELDLGRRQQWWTLLELARARGVDQGWVSKRKLARLAQVNEHTLDMHLTRARRLLSDRGVKDAHLLIDVAENQRRLALPPERIFLDDAQSPPSS